MNHFDVLNACMKAIDRCRENGYTPYGFVLPGAAIEALKEEPIDGRATVATSGTLRGFPIVERNDVPAVVRGKRGESIYCSFTIDLPVEEKATEPVRLAFEVTLRGSYVPPREVYGGVADPEQWAAMDEGRIIKDLPRFVSILPTIAPDADISVHVEPVTRRGDAFVTALFQLERAITAPQGFRALVALADAQRAGSSGKQAREFAQAISALEEAEWRYRRGVEMLFFDEKA